MKLFRLCCAGLGLAVAVALAAEPPPPAQPVPAGPVPLAIRGESFVDPQGQIVRFWGVNLIALYPEHAAADALAANLAALQINLVRPHHLLRPSLDWNPGMASGSLALYQHDSRTLDPKALERFDYLNGALRRHGIYLALPLNASRLFWPGDVDILQTDAADRTAWMAAVEELNARPWQQSIDVYKMLPTVDERSALLNAEFARILLGHVNPHTGLAYGQDPQVLTLEVMNEASTEYAVICGNRFPDYWHKKLVALWNAYAQAAGIAAGDLYRPADAQAVAVRARFLRKLDADYFERIKAAVRATGCRAPLEFSNLWRGENALQLHAEHSDFMENHSYMDPFVVGKALDGFYELSQSQLAGKPFIVGELNQAEGDENIHRQAPARTMLPLAACAYGSLQGWSGIAWFAWLHGGQALGPDGWSTAEGREAELGRMMNDGMLIDHLRTAGLIFRRRLVAPSQTPLILSIAEPFVTGDYEGLMRGKGVYQPGWQNISAIRKVFAPAPDHPAAAPWMTRPPENPLVSDTGEIVKDIQRRQLTVAAPQAEGFSGWLDGSPPAGLWHLELEGRGFATVILVADDGAEFAASRRLILSKTALDAKHAETAGLKIRLCGLAPASGERHWHVRLTRPRQAAALLAAFTQEDWQSLTPADDGYLELPVADWHECELSLQ